MPKVFTPIKCKVCEQCGATFYNKKHVSASEFAKRRFCSYACSNSETSRKIAIKHGTKILAAHCDCGALATDLVWFVQLGGNGYPIKTFLEVCPDCRDTMLEIDKHATLIEPPEPDYREYAPVHRVDYHYKASFAGKRQGGPHDG